MHLLTIKSSKMIQRTNVFRNRAEINPTNAKEERDVVSGLNGFHER